MCYRTAWLVKHKLLEAMKLAEADHQLIGRVEDDAAYLCGQRSGGKTGRGSDNKVPLVAALQTIEGGQPHLACLSQRPFTKESLEAFFARSTVLQLTVVSDGLGCFTVASSLGASHDRTVTGGGGGGASVEWGQFRSVNAFISNIKTALSGPYRAVRFAKYAFRYLAEARFRFNRRSDLRAILGSRVRAMVRTPPWPERVNRVAELHR